MASEDRIEVEKIEELEGGGFLTWLKGHAYPVIGLPRKIMIHKLDPTKKLLEMAIEQIWKGFCNDFKKPEDLAPSVRELYNLFNQLLEHETTERRIRIYSKVRDLICFFLDEDTAYRWRFQWMMERVDPEKFKLTEADKYWFSKSDEFRLDEDVKEG